VCLLWSEETPQSRHGAYILAPRRKFQCVVYTGIACTLSAVRWDALRGIYSDVTLPYLVSCHAIFLTDTLRFTLVNCLMFTSTNTSYYIKQSRAHKPRTLTFENALINQPGNKCKRYQVILSIYVQLRRLQHPQMSLLDEQTWHSKLTTHQLA
jgi:hypothetical protein